MRTERQQEQLDEIFDYYSKQKDRQTQEQVVALLREIQELLGCVDREAREKVLEVTGVGEGFLKTILRLYPSIKEASNLHEIIACTGERCGKKDGMEILRKLRKELGVTKDGISADGQFRLRTQNCLKQCRTSPNMIIDGILYSGEQLQDIRQLLEQIRENKER